MSVTFVCPACSTPVAVVYNVPDRCPKCGAELPAPLRASLEEEHLRYRFPLPPLLWVGRFCTGSIGVLLTVFLILAPFDIGTYRIGTDQVSGPEFLRQAGVIFGVFGLLMLATAYALWTEQSWGRWAMMAYWPVAAVATFFMPTETTGDAVASLFFFLVAALIAGWYLFGKENVVAYYQRLERQEDSSAKVTSAA